MIVQSQADPGVDVIRVDALQKEHLEEREEQEELDYIYENYPNESESECVRENGCGMVE